MKKKILIAVLLLMVASVAFAATLPSTITNMYRTWPQLRQWLLIGHDADGTTKAEMQEFSITIYDPNSIADDDPNVPIFPIESEIFASGITLYDVGIKTSESSTYSVTFYDFNSPTDASPNTIEVVATSTSTEAEDDGTLTTSAIAAGDIIYVLLPTAKDVNFVEIWGSYKK